VKVVSPEWIIDSVKAGHCMDENCYQLPCPTAMAEDNIADNKNMQEITVGSESAVDDRTKVIDEASTTEAADKKVQGFAETGDDMPMALSLVSADERSQLSVLNGVNNDNINICTHKDSTGSPNISADFDEIGREQVDKDVCEEICGEEIVDIDDSLTECTSAETCVAHVASLNNQSVRETTEQTGAVLDKGKALSGYKMDEPKIDSSCLPGEHSMDGIEKFNKIEPSRSSTTSPSAEWKDGIELISSIECVTNY
jgi:hypothetical protein